MKIIGLLHYEEMVNIFAKLFFAKNHILKSFKITNYNLSFLIKPNFY